MKPSTTKYRTRWAESWVAFCAALALLLLAALAVPAPAPAAFGFQSATAGFSAAALKADGSPENRAGIHPRSFELALRRNLGGSGAGEGALRELGIDLPAGFLINPATFAGCTPAQFSTPRSSPYEASQSGESCPEGSQVGVIAVRSEGATRHFGLYNLQAPYGSPLALGASPFGVGLTFIARVREADAGLSLELAEVPESFDLAAIELTLWGTPYNPIHDPRRGNCLREPDGGSHGSCDIPGFPSLKAREERMKALLTLPTSCDGPMRFAAAATSWAGESAQAEALSRDAKGDPLSVTACKDAATDANVRLPTNAASTGTGLIFELDVDDGGGVLNPLGIARPSIATAHLQLPEGLTLNPSLGNGLGVCEEDDFAREKLGSAFGAGCPGASKVGTVELEGMLGLAKDATGFGLGPLQKPLTGSVFLARPHENRFGAPLALYLVASLPERGLIVKSAGEVSLDPASGAMAIAFEDLPRLLYERFTVRLREGQRPALVSPPACGTHTTTMRMSAWGRPEKALTDSAAFALSSGCPPPGGPPFAPTAIAGALNPQAGAPSTYLINLSRTDAEAEITSYSLRLPPGAAGSLAGLTYCPEAAIAAAGRRSGTEELERPSCPASSRIGRTLSGYGAGRVLAHAPGTLHLAGPYRGAPVSVVAINPAVAGPFDLGTVVVRSAITLDPRSAALQIDGSRSDPIPHILAGVPLHLREVRVYLDRPGFMRNPTSCERFSLRSELSGSVVPFTDPRSRGALLDTPFQAFGCSALGFSPSLSMRLRGKTRRAAYPRLSAVLTSRAGDANIERIQVTMPGSLFLAQEHLRGVCSVAHFEAGRCPPSTAYGQLTAWTPLLEEPLRGEVYLRTSRSRLPDLAIDLRSGPIRILLAGRTGAVGAGRLQASFEDLPDAPFTRAVFELAGGKRGLLVNSTNLCKARPRATVRMLGQHNRGVLREAGIGVGCGRGAPPVVRDRGPR